MPSPPCRILAVLGFDDIVAAAEYVPCVLDFGPIGLEGMDDELVHYMKKKHIGEADRALLPEGKGWLLAEFGADTREEAIARAQSLIDAAARERKSSSCELFSEEQRAERLWRVRESGLGATSFVPGEPATHPGWEDAAAAPEKLGSYLRRFRELLGQFDYRGALYGHFGDGCVHVRISSDLSSEQGVSQWRRFVDRAADLVLEHGGSLSGEHGDGQARGELLEKMYGPELMQAMREFKRIWDPRGRMNPGKVVDAHTLDTHLREGPDLKTPALESAFAYPEDGGDLMRATRRCVGVGECRREWGTVMCPSYQVTREEMHSTRGRARLFFEMLRGMQDRDAPLRDGWRNEAVHEALELCLACKGCKSDCPVSVDMATYKAEFMRHYYRGRVRPRMAYSMGLIYWWARIGRHVAPLANAVTHLPGSSRLFKAVSGIAAARDVPRFAFRPFTKTFEGSSA